MNLLLIDFDIRRKFRNQSSANMSHCIIYLYNYMKNSS